MQHAAEHAANANHPGFCSSERSNPIHHVFGRHNWARFLDYLKNVLIPTLHRGDIVVMDNMRSHHVKGVVEALREAGMIPLYLPPYSPDLNPIEMMWSKIKTVLRKWGCRVAAHLPQMIIKAFSLVSPNDCLGWFDVDGY